jgi:hypothetical protein
LEIMTLAGLTALGASASLASVLVYVWRARRDDEAELVDLAEVVDQVDAVQRVEVWRSGRLVYAGPERRASARAQVDGIGAASPAKPPKMQVKPTLDSGA